ncbi:DJ-1 family glyoxalase III [Lachnospiraceae bacterium 62-35]
MAHVYAFLAPGLEEVECLAAMDVLVRAGVSVSLVSITDTLEVTGSHQFTIKADCLMKDVEWEKADVLFLPGGMPGTINLASCQELTEQLVKGLEAGKRLAAICAAPSVLGGLGLLKGKKATCYPGFEEKLLEADSQKAGVVTDGQITTARGLGYALDLGLELVRLLIDEETSKKIKASIQYDQF